MEVVTNAINVDKQIFQQEQTHLIKTLLNERFFKPWRMQSHDSGTKYDLQLESGLEIYITSACNQKCEYCYLQKYPDLYPQEVNKKEIILHNLKILIDWIEKAQFILPKLELYSGEIWHNEYGLEVLEILYQSLSQNQWTNYIIIPSNCSFVLNEHQLNLIQRYINKFAKVNVCLCFSISVDGAIVENDMRPLTSSEIKTDAFYDRLFLFAKHNNFFFHPMVAANSISRWIENYEWWKNMCAKYRMDCDEILMLLEVRNEGWSEENIQDYCKFLDYLIEDYKTRKCNNDNNIFFKHLFGFSETGNLGGYVPYALSSCDTFAGCTVANNLTVRLGDMAICPCHRTAYNKFLYGWFVVENNEIIDIVGNNPQMAIRILMANNNYASMGCDTCEINSFCLKGCFGSQFESEGDPFFPIANICKFFKAKYNFLINKYKEMNVQQFLDGYTHYSMHYPQVMQYKKIFKKQGDYK